MTIPRTPAELANDATRIDLALIDALLAETPDFAPSADTAAAAELRNALLSIRSLTHLPAPTPSAELAAHFAAATASAASTATAATGTGNPLASLSAHRRNRRRSATIIALSVAATIGLGTSAAAAVSPEFRAGAAQVLETIASTIVSTVTGNPPATEDTPGAPVPSDPASNTPADDGVLGTDPLIPNPSELWQPGKSPAPTAIPGEDGIGQMPGKNPPLIPDAVPGD